MIIQNFINQALLSDPNFSLALKNIDGKSLLLNIHLHEGEKNIYILFTPTGIQFIASIEIPDATITAPLKALTCFALTRNIRKASELGLTTTGNIALLETLQHLFLHLDIDWEEPLSQWVGDEIAHPIGQLANNIYQKQKSITHKMFEQISEYIQEESGLIAHPVEMNTFMDNVDTIHSHYERLNARVRQLMLTLQNKGMTVS